ncbi:MULTISPECIES: hypothetical protein [Pseudomonas]|uniref:Uncharacterized protein n=1 Tax=Pseudomonas wuhanensis TaxID=2954098 RepID=A0ABY9GLC6_9PSED|nr:MULTISPECIES: hypothetical protein [unclassified Pseudomonas]WLI10756.1 hypothetical protein PSH65_21465 [Pseudomonas sp. FP603]WLI16575.1 hypothetical protein PSH88_20090 [Pseudomonas sp. FP607]
MIIAHVAADCPQTAVRDLERLADTSRHLRQILTVDGTFAPHFKLLKSLVSTFNGILSKERLSPLAISSTLPMMPPKQRHQVVERIQNELITDMVPVPGGTPPRTLKLAMLQSIGHQLTLFTPADRMTLVDEVCRLPNFAESGFAIGAMGTQSSQLELAEHDKLLAAAFALADRSKPPAILGLITGLAALNSDQRLMLLGAALAADPEHLKTLYLCSLGRKAGDLDKTLHPLLLNAGLGLSANHRAYFVRDCAHGLASFTPNQQQRLIDAACQFEEGAHGTTALSGFGASLKDISLDQRAQLIDATLKLDQHATIGVAIQGMCAGMASLDSTQQDALVSAACRMGANENKATTLRSLGSTVGTLEHSQHQRIINAVFALPTAKLQASALTGLCAQLKALNVEQRASLVNRVLNLEDQLTKALLLVSMVPSIAFLPFETHRRLVDAVKAITDEPIKRWVMGELTHAIMSFEPELQQELIDIIFAQPANEVQASNIAELARALKPKAF